MKNSSKRLEVLLYTLSVLAVGSIQLFKFRIIYLNSSFAVDNFSKYVSRGLYVAPLLLMTLNIGLLLIFRKKRVDSKFWLVAYSFLTILIIGILTLVHSRQLPYDLNYFYSQTGILPLVEVFIYLYLSALFILGTKIKIYPPKIKSTNISGIIQFYFYRIPLLIFLLWASFSFVSLSKIPGLIAHSGYASNLTLDPRIDDIVKIGDLTPTDSVIVHPLRTAEYPFIGNQVMMRYYLTHRILVTPEKLGKLLKEHVGRIYFIGIKNNETGYFWPIIDYDKSVIFAISRNDADNKCRFESFDVTWISNYYDLISVQCKDIL